MNIAHVSIIGIIGIILNATQYVSCATVTHADETSLRSTLQSDYDRYARPYNPTEVALYYNIRALVTLDITTQTMVHNGWFVMRWHDPRLTWTPSSYSNITNKDVNWVWRPELIISNSASEFTRLGYDNDATRLTVFNDGSVRWLLVEHITTSCEVEVSKFPFDDQDCRIDIGFWGHDYGTDLEITLNFTKVNSAFMLQNGEWEMETSYIQNSIANMCCPATDVFYLKIFMSFKRLRPFYIINLLLPAMLLSLCMIWAFLIPTDCGERLGYTLTILLSYTVLMTITSELLPTTSLSVPYIATYLLIILVLCSTAVCSVGLHVKWYFMDGNPPKILKISYIKLKPIFYFQYFERNKVESLPQETGAFVEDIECNVEKAKIPEKNKTNASDNVSVIEKVNTVEENVTWKDVSILSDRIAFYAYLLAIVIVNFWLILSLVL